MLVVDLDGTLIRSDMLYETFWSAFASDWTVPFSAAASLLKGRAALKQKMSDLAKVDVTALPYDDAVIDRIRRWREGGGRTVLVTASNQDIAQEIAAHLGEVLWVTGQREEALIIWREALEKNPDSEILRDVMRRFAPGAP